MDAPTVVPHFRLIAHSLSDEFGLEPEDRAWLEHACRCFPAPIADDIPLVLSAFVRLATKVLWSAEVLPAETFYGPAERILSIVRSKGGAKPSDLERRKRDFVGEYLLAGTLCKVPTGFSPPKGEEALRVSLVACAWRWTGSESPRSTAIQALASAIRGIQASPIGQDLLLKMGEATTLDDFVKIAAALCTSGHATLSATWRNHYDPELRKTPRARVIDTQPTPPPTEPPVRKPIHSPKPSVSGLGASRRSGWIAEDEDEDILVEHIQRARRPGTQPRPVSGPAPLPDESLDEVTPPLLVDALPEQTTNPDAADIQRYQVQQAIWNSNPLQLVEHRSAVQFATYAAAVQAALELLRDPNISSELRCGAAAVLLQALTGRTTTTLTGVEVLADASQPHDPAHIDVLLAEGAFRLSIFWQVAFGGNKPSYFRASSDQQIYLEAAHPSFQVPLVPPIATALRSVEPELKRLAGMTPSAIADLLRQAARHICQLRQLQFTHGQIRVSLAAHLVEQCGDIAAAQLLCADTLGQAIASLAYYAPRIGTLADIHWDHQNRLLGTQYARPRSPTDDDRVGSHLLVSPDTARSMVRSLARVRHRGVSYLVDAGRVHEVHRDIVNHLAGMLVAVATHRPSEALFALTVNDIWIDGKTGAALFRDKVIDAAHDPRLVALPPMLCRQIEAYFEHLAGLAEQLPALTAHIENVFSGTAPLLFSVTGNNAAATLDLGLWKASLPDSWGVLPYNWGRHWVRTRAIEQGIRPELVSMQLGHLEMVGYPFSGASPTEPWLFVDELATDWEHIAIGQGWSLARGLTSSTAWSPQLLGPLHPWRSRVSQQEARQRALIKEWQDVWRAKLRTCRKDALARVEADAELVAAGIITRFRDRKACAQPHDLTRADFERIRDRLQGEASDDTARAIALADAVCRVARIVNRRTGQRAQTPSSLYVLRRPLDNAFVPGMMEAVRQVHALREHCASLSRHGSRHTWNDMISACGHVVLAITLFGRVESPEKIRGALERRTKLQRSARLQDVVFVPFGDAPHEVLVWRGVAAIAFARLAKRFPDEALPTWDQIEQHVASVLPHWALNGSSGNNAKDIVSLLCETAAVAHRYELSPAARLATQDQGGSTPAHMMEQLAFLDGDAPGTIERTWEEQEQGEAQAVQSAPATARVRSGNARTQYLQLCAALPTSERDTTLSSTQANILASNANSPAARTKVVAEITARLDETDPVRCLQPIVRVLAGWTLDMLVCGTQRRDSPAISTVRTYLSRIGAALVHFFGQSSLDAMDEATLEEAYLTAIASKPNLREGAAAAILWFHVYAQEHYEFPEIDLSQIRLYLGSDPEALSDAKLILPQERNAVLDLLAAQAAQVSAAPDHGRTVRLAAYVMPLMAQGGMRRAEALGIQFRDVRTDDGNMVVSVRPNRSRRVKTASARREVSLPIDAVQVLNVDLPEWIDIERARIGGRRRETAFVSSSSQAPFDPKTQEDVRRICVKACREITGRERPHLHRLRHLVAMERTTALFLGESDLEVCSPAPFPAPIADRPTPLALPRDLQRTVIALGHANPATTLRSYHHMPWLLASRSDARDRTRYVKPLILAGVLGQSPNAIYLAASRRQDRPTTLAWLDAQLCPRRPAGVAPTKKSIPIPPPAPDDGPIVLQTLWTAQDLGVLLAETARIGSLDEALLVTGRAVSDAEPLRQGFASLEIRLGLRLLIERRYSTNPSQPKRAVRPLKASARMELIWQWYDADVAGLRMPLAQLAEAVDRHMKRGHRDRLLVPPSSAVLLREVLSRVGIDARCVIESDDESGLTSMRVLRGDPASPGGSPTAASYLGLELKRVLLIVRAASRIVV